MLRSMDDDIDDAGDASVAPDPTAGATIGSAGDVASEASTPKVADDEDGVDEPGTDEPGACEPGADATGVVGARSAKSSSSMRYSFRKPCGRLAVIAATRRRWKNNRHRHDMASPTIGGVLHVGASFASPPSERIERAC